ncbi:uncharacterized protein DUF4054 [Serratia fonticola]|jgi:hypothetical protein|uniref:Uncharacterized protein DUF4054 n=1 Tax=Serratia fonticola TaxID=47917 RepID=A0A542D4H9_SERFO|nr:DUF4054 domain-containing protein [Serratia fonticola]TQI79992.1 uncharacterized protein DUF4054 [Serratia fonticola]TQI97982.1 uncharacterized protein DUF4054 [Serratia fonticola]TVZ72477.1 uncharacterized protein DUF4054 [Serratia fonticola]
MEYVIDLQRFRDLFPAMSDVGMFTDATIQTQWEQAQYFISPDESLQEHRFENALYLMTAHLVWLHHAIAQGHTTAGIVTSATISKVSVSIALPPCHTARQFWLATTPYGLQLLALCNEDTVSGGAE